MRNAIDLGWEVAICTISVYSLRTVYLPILVTGTLCIVSESVHE